MKFQVCRRGGFQRPVVQCGAPTEHYFIESLRKLAKSVGLMFSVLTTKREGREELGGEG